MDQDEPGKGDSPLGPMAEKAWSGRTIRVDAPELASLSTWASTSEQRRREIAEAVTAELGPGFRLARLEQFGGPSIAVISRGSEEFCVVPGGTVEIGFSPEEEAEVRRAAERAAGCGNHYEQYEFLLEQLEIMRPLSSVTVGPMLAARNPGTGLDPAAAADELEQSLLRLPSEAEWEHLARGGRARELTYHGTGAPDSTEWFESVRRLGAAGSNIFGLWGFGFQPEICADVYHPDHNGLPADGSPRRGAGPRVAKGGASQLYPWQACGEWHLLLTAMRTPASMWEFTQSLRFTLGIEVS